jgi:hypothetical protein
MMDTPAGRLKPYGAPTPRGTWVTLAWKVLLALAILLLMTVGTPISWLVSWGFLNPIPATLVLWGFLLVGVASANLFEGSQRQRLLWTLLTLCAYGVLTIPGVLVGPDRTVEALGPVAALTLVVHLGRRDLPRALRDWALVMALALYASLGVQAMWLVINSFGSTYGLVVFMVAVLLPPLLFEAASLVLRRVERFRTSVAASIVGLLLATALGMTAFSLTILNSSTTLSWRIVFGLLAGIVIGGALLVGLFTRPLISAASGARASQGTPGRGLNLARTLVELSHEPILISLALYIPLRLISYVATQ